MDTQRVIALIVFSASSLFLWEAWQKQSLPSVQTTQVQPISPAVKPDGSALPSTVPVGATAPAPPSSRPADSLVARSEKRILIKTDMLNVSLDSLGGDIHEVVLLKHAGHSKGAIGYPLMQDKAGSMFVTQTGLIGDSLPNHLSQWSAEASSFELGGNDALDVALTNREVPGITVTKTYTFKRGSYLINIRFDIKNDTGVALSPAAYFQFVRDANPPEGEHAGGNPFTGVVTFTGPAVYTDQKKFQKVTFSEIDKSKFDYPKESNDGWLAMVQHYFVSAWVPKEAIKREFFTQRVKGADLYTAGIKLPVAAITAGGTASITMPLYVGPQEQENLKKLAPGLDLVVDYGWLTILAYPMFVVLSWIHTLVGNWGWTIIIFTILIKLVFFPLNQKAGKSMAHMKQLAPKIEAMKARFGDDKLKMNQAMMELYRTEKINPLGGCLPILVQMPFFIALYWVLLGAVELRNAPWIGWIQDLSTPDPFYVLPIIMGASMIIQTKLNPAPADPVQAKVMMIMPIVFSIMFFFFPAGLVLYWTMQNLLGIAQQWYINKSLESAVPSPAKR